MPTALVRAEMLYAWKGSSLLIVTPAGSCDPKQSLCGFYYREARFLRTFRLTLNGISPWLCEAARLDPTRLAFSYAHPELTVFGGGGTGQSDEEESRDQHGLAHRSLTVNVVYAVEPRGLIVNVAIANHARRAISCDAAIDLGADFIDIQEAMGPSPPPARAAVVASVVGEILQLRHDHEQLPYRACVSAAGDSAWRWTSTSLQALLQLAPHETSQLTLRLCARVGAQPDLEPDADDAARERHIEQWRRRFTHVAIPANRLAEDIVARNVRDFASFALLDGPSDEWLALQAGMPSYPALFGRDTLTAGRQAAFVDHAESLAASLTVLGRMQSDRINDWRDEEPGRIPYQVRRGPQAILGVNPYAGYYADFASPLMYVIALAHLFSWTGEKRDIERHWDTVRRILEWARTYGDKDGDGYLEYRTRSSKGTKNQGWKDSGDAIVYDDGAPVPPPIATCEIQGYWFAAQQLMSVLCAVMGAAGDARAYWQSAIALKTRFNRDWWMDDVGSVALAMDPDKRLVRAMTSNIGRCIATGIVSDEHLPAAVGSLFAPDMFSGWGVRTLSSSHRAYNPVSYHCGTVWAVEQATIAFGLRRFGFDARALDLTRALFELAAFYPDYRIPECIGGWSRAERDTPGAYPRANTPQLWNATAFPLLVHTVLGLQPVAALQLLVVDPVLPAWMPESVLEHLRLGNAIATLRFWRTADGKSHAEVVRKRGTLRLVHQPPIESLKAGVRDRMSALMDTVLH
jgi:glycogen debranching enzyme